MAWEAVAAGVLVALVAGFMAWLAGFGILAGAFDARFDAGSAQLLSPAGIASLVGAVVALAAGGFTAARLAGARQRREALFCGLLTFSTAVVVALLVMTQDPPALVARGIGPVGNAVEALAARPSDAGTGDAREPLAALRAEVRGSLAREPSADAPEGDADAAAATVLAGISEMANAEAEARAVEAIVAASGVTRSVAERRLTEWQIANDRAVRGERRATAEISGEVAGACLAAFAALLAAMAAAVLGGMLGRVGDSALEIGAI